MSRHTISKKISAMFAVAISCGAFYGNHPVNAMKANVDEPLLSSEPRSNATYIGTKENNFAGRLEFISNSGDEVIDQNFQYVRNASDNDKETLKKHPLFSDELFTDYFPDLKRKEGDNENPYIFSAFNRNNSTKISILRLPADPAKCIIVISATDGRCPGYLRVTNGGKTDWLFITLDGGKRPSNLWPSIFDFDNLFTYLIQFCTLEEYKCKPKLYDFVLTWLRNEGIPGFEGNKRCCDICNIF